MLKPVQVPSAPKPVGPYSSAMIVGNLVYVSGQSGRDPVTDHVADDIFCGALCALAQSRSFFGQRIIFLSSVFHFDLRLRRCKARSPHSGSVP